jgi:phospholipid/cholesterol/gamma-HCH transport system ATP-binding protein
MNSAPSIEPVISFEQVRIGFGEGDVLRGVTLGLASRETKVLVGETGTGKTLLLKLAAGLLKPTAGRVIVLGREVSAMSERELLDFRRQIGFVFQEGALFDSMSVADNVAYRLHEEHADDEEIEQRVRETLRFVEMEHAYDLYPSELSGGMRRRVSIARALITSPEVVLYDSPTAGLDPVTAQTIIALLLRLRDTAGVTSLVATHRIQDAFAMANFHFDAASGRIVPITASNGLAPTSVALLRDGLVSFEGSVEELARSSDAYVRKFLV